MSFLSGYSGIFTIPTSLNTKFGSSMYCITDKPSVVPTIVDDTLVCIVLSPSGFSEIYRICKRYTYENIYIIPISMDIVFQSDIFNALMYFKNLKKSVRWIYPIKMKNTSVEVEAMQIVADTFTFNTLRNTRIDFMLTMFDDRKFYDIKLYDTLKTRYFSIYNTVEKMNILYDNPELNEIHIGYDSTIYGGLNYLQLVSLNPKFRNKLVVHSFSSEYEYLEAIDDKTVHIGEVLFNALI